MPRFQPKLQADELVRGCTNVDRWIFESRVPWSEGHYTDASLFVAYLILQAISQLTIVWSLRRCFSLRSLCWPCNVGFLIITIFLQTPLKELMGSNSSDPNKKQKGGRRGATFSSSSFMHGTRELLFVVDSFWWQLCFAPRDTLEAFRASSIDPIERRRRRRRSPTRLVLWSSCSSIFFDEESSTFPWRLKFFSWNPIPLFVWNIMEAFFLSLFLKLFL